MTWRTILAAAVFIGMCGFIAYWGDVLGRRMGKRRLSLFGLRPRYTAIVTTTITGMLIAVLTIAFMATVSQRVRLLMLRGEEILRERSVIRQRYKSARESADQATKEARKAQRQRDVLTSDIESMTVDLHELQADFRQNEEDLACTEKELADAKRNLADARREIAETREELTGQRAEVSDLKRQRSDLKQGLADAKLEIAEAKEELTERKAEVSDLERQRAALTADREILFAELGEAAAKYTRYIALRQGRVIFRSNEELTRRAIRCAQPKVDIRTEVLQLLGEAHKLARSQGAKIGDNGRAVRILAKKLETEDPGRELFLEESATIDAIVDQVSSGSGTVVTRVLSVGNSVEGEQALIEFILNYNLLVYSAGDEVAQTVIQGGASQGKVLGQVIRFLRTEVRLAAIGRGIIPHYDKEQGQPSVGQISPDHLLDIVDRVKAAGGPVTLTALAKVDAWSAGPLELDFRIGAAE